MALIEQNGLFDRLKEYIDAKIDNLSGSIRSLFDEYDIKIIGVNMDDIKKVGGNLGAINDIADNLDELLETDDYRDQAYKWSSEDEDIPVDDGVHQGYSAYHWARKAEEVELDTYRKTDFISSSAGSPDANKPIVLNPDGMIDNSMLDLSGASYQDKWTPSSGSEYPDKTGTTAGAYWIVQGLGSGGYTFTGGDLAGETATNGDYMIVGSDDTWSLIKNEMDAGLYYLRDGSQPITGPLAGGGQKGVNFANGTSTTDLATYGQVSGKADKTYVDGTFVKKSGDTMTGPLKVSPRIINHEQKVYGLQITADGNVDEVLLAGKMSDNSNWDYYNCLIYDPDGSNKSKWKIGQAGHGNIIWHAGNVGPGSGLDADTVDGKHASSFAPYSHVSDTSNPHGVTKSQVGLDFVVDDGDGSQYLANDGTYKAIKGVPQGAIILWSGTSVPLGWALCDGSNGTPNLVDRFVLGSSTANIGDIGGSANAVVVSHSHSATFSGDKLPEHSHSLSKDPLTYVGTGGIKDMDQGQYWDDISVSTDSVSAGTPSGTVTVSSVGEDGTNKNMPPYYKLAYIMKL